MSEPKENKVAQPPTVDDVEDDNASGPDEEVETAEGVSAPTGASKKKKKKSKTKKLRDALTGKSGGESSSAADAAPKTASGLSQDQFQQLLALNPALKNELAGVDQAKLAEMMKKISLAETLTGMSVTGKNQKDMASYKFWQTQPVQSFEDAAKKPAQEGPIKIIDPASVPKESPPMAEGFDWVTMDLDKEEELKEVFELLSDHYVEDADATFRFYYSASFLNWALKSPGWKKEWHVGVRASKSRKLVAFISAIPVDFRIRDNQLKGSEVNFLCVHRKLRNKRLVSTLKPQFITLLKGDADNAQAPVLIKEITRRNYIEGVFQALYTGGILLPTPVATCRYYHRSLDWQKLYDTGFSPLPPGSTPLRQAARFKLPEKTLSAGLRPMEAKDVPTVADLLTRYLSRFDLNQMFCEEEVKHWLLHDPKICPERIIYSYVIEDSATGKVTDFVSFYRLSSTVIKPTSKHQYVNAAYLYYYASETAFGNDEKKTKVQLNALIKDALILAKQEKFDVMNALTLLDNPLFLEEQLFGAGDGQLHYYVYNYRAAQIEGGLGKDGRASGNNMGGVGVVML
jgi:glycylpeptide N-tetradecanoyltransferase